MFSSCVFSLCVAPQPIPEVPGLDGAALIEYKIRLAKAHAVKLEIEAKAQMLAQTALLAGGEAPVRYFREELEINDYAQHARWKVTHREAVNNFQDEFDVAITPKGQFYDKGQRPPEGERKLYLIIEGKDEDNVTRARLEIKKILEETTQMMAERGGGGGALGGRGRYQVV